MISTTRLALPCLMVVLSFALCAQSSSPISRHWQISIGAQYAQGRKTSSSAAQPLESFRYGGNLEYVLPLPKLTMTCFMYAGFQQLRAEGEDVVVDHMYGLEETLGIDNMLMGPGLELKLNNRGKYHPLLGGQAFLGFSVNSEYSFDNIGTSLLLANPLPVIYEAKGGAGLYSGAQVFAGLERVFTEKIQLRIKACFGEHFQFAAWQLPEPLNLLQPDSNNAQLIRGGYWQASLEVIHRL